MEVLKSKLSYELKESYYGVADNIHQLVEKLKETDFKKDTELAMEMEKLFKQMELGKYI